MQHREPLPFQVDLLLVYDVRAVGVALVAADNYLTAFKLQYSIDHISNLAYVMDGSSERVSRSYTPSVQTCYNIVTPMTHIPERPTKNVRLM